MKRGKLIVVDGIDGSGKATQVKLLEKRLRKDGVKVKTIDFPRYYNNFFGKLIGEYLSGMYGDFTKIDPRVGSILYAADRFESSKQIKKWLAGGYAVVADRYVSANQIHQGGKINDIEERKKFLEWLDKMEYSVFKSPKPDLVIYLDIPYEVSRMWLKKKIALRKKRYLKGRVDVAEDNLVHLKNSRQSALLLQAQKRNWRKVECCEGGMPMSPDKIHELVYKLVKKKLKISR